MRSARPKTTSMSCSTITIVTVAAQAAASARPSRLVSLGLMPAAGSSSSSSFGFGRERKRRSRAAAFLRTTDRPRAPAPLDETDLRRACARRVRMRTLRRGQRNRRRRAESRRASPRAPARGRFRRPTGLGRSASSDGSSRSRAARRASRRSRVMRSPLKQISPEFGWISPASILKNVVFPAPLGPISAVTVSDSTASETLVDRDEAAEALRQFARFQERHAILRSPRRAAAGGACIEPSRDAARRCRAGSP